MSKKIKRNLLLVLALSFLPISSFNSSAQFLEKTNEQTDNMVIDGEKLVFDNEDEYISYVAYSVKNGEEFYMPRAVGEILDYKDSIYFWTKTKTGKCISRVISPTRIVKSVIFGFSPAALKKMGAKGIAQKLKNKGIAYSIAYSIGECFIRNYGK